MRLLRPSDCVCLCLFFFLLLSFFYFFFLVLCSFIELTKYAKLIARAYNSRICITAFSKILVFFSNVVVSDMTIGRNDSSQYYRCSLYCVVFKQIADKSNVHRNRITTLNAYLGFSFNVNKCRCVLSNKHHHFKNRKRNKKEKLTFMSF